MHNFRAPSASRGLGLTDLIIVKMYNGSCCYIAWIQNS